MPVSTINMSKIPAMTSKTSFLSINSDMYDHLLMGLIKGIAIGTLNPKNAYASYQFPGDNYKTKFYLHDTGNKPGLIAIDPKYPKGRHVITLPL